MMNSEQIKPAPAPADDSERERAVNALAESFAVIEEHREYLPGDFYRNFTDGLADWIADAQWTSNPDLMRQILPILLREVLMDEEES
jgi:hypothetical protein